MDAGGDNDDIGGLGEQQSELQQQVGQQLIAYSRAKADLEQATLRQQQ